MFCVLNVLYVVVSTTFKKGFANTEVGKFTYENLKKRFANTEVGVII
jgi:hypothetical protein